MALSRRQFIESQGATCQNWTWSWSFIDEEGRRVIFGAWDVYQSGAKALILSERWQTRRNGKRNPSFSQSREHVRLIAEEGYELFTFSMKHASTNDGGVPGPAKIAGFTPKLSRCELLHIAPDWYACTAGTPSLYPDEADTSGVLTEGAVRKTAVNSYERNVAARDRCLAHYGYSCRVCSFNFERVYGSLGKDFIHVHHIVPLASIGKTYVVDPIADLIPVCPNCHAMLHATRPALSIEQLRTYWAQNTEGAER